MATTAEKLHTVLVANPALYARALEVIGEIHKLAGPFNAGDLGDALRTAAKASPPLTKGGGYSVEFIDHYVNPPAK